MYDIYIILYYNCTANVLTVSAVCDISNLYFQSFRPSVLKIIVFTVSIIWLKTNALRNYFFSYSCRVDHNSNTGDDVTRARDEPHTVYYVFDSYSRAAGVRG